MPYTTQVLDQLVTEQPTRACCAKAALSTLLRTSASLRISADGAVLVARTTRPQAARAIISLLRSVTGFGSSVYVAKERLRQRVFEVHIDDPAVVDAIRRLDLLPAERRRTSSAHATCCTRAVLWGTLLGCGYVRDPRRGTDIEFYIGNEGDASDLRGRLGEIGVSAGLQQRENAFIVYVRRFEDARTLLAAVGATVPLFALEERKIFREMRGDVNRRVNCDQHNTVRIVDAATCQIGAIHHIESTVGLDMLPSALREAADLRLRHPYASISELGERCSPELSKSAMNHRLRRIVRFARELAGASEEQGRDARWQYG